MQPLKRSALKNILEQSHKQKEVCDPYSGMSF